MLGAVVVGLVVLKDLPRVARDLLQGELCHRLVRKARFCLKLSPSWIQSLLKPGSGKLLGIAGMHWALFSTYTVPDHVRHPIVIFRINWTITITGLVLLTES